MELHGPSTLTLQLGLECQAGRVYAFYCDDGFGTIWNCLRTKHCPPVGGDLSECQEAENKVMRKVCETIEWSFAW